MLKLSALILIFTASNALANNLNNYYQEGLAAAHANMQKPKEQVENYKPEEKFTNYNNQPPQMSYYHGVKGYKTEELQTAGAAAAVYNEQDDQNSAVQAAKKSLQRNPKERINAADPWLNRSGKIMNNAADLALGVSSKNNEGVKHDTKAGVNCQEAKTCRIELVKKTCNEAKTVYKICEKTPKITTSMETVLYPNCQQAMTTAGNCPGGYYEVAYSNKKENNPWGTVRVCAKAANTNDAECLAGYITYRGCGGSSTSTASTGSTVVPKHIHARIRFTGIYQRYHMPITIINRTTGSVVYNDGHFTNGQVVELPFSDTQDQLFEYYHSGDQTGAGLMSFYVDHSFRAAAAKVESWSEANCHEE